MCQSLSVTTCCSGCSNNRTRKAIQFISFLISLGIVARIGTRTPGLTTSLNYYQSLSKDLTESLEEKNYQPYHYPKPARFPGSGGPPKQRRIRPPHSRKRRSMPNFGESLLLLHQKIRCCKRSSKKSDKQGLKNMSTTQ